MEDATLHALRQEPPREFAATLAARLRDSEHTVAHVHAWRGSAFAWPVAVAAVVAIALNVPAVRASAASFLALFRVTNFVVVTPHLDSFNAAVSRRVELEQLIGDRVQIVQDPGPGTTAASLKEAAELAGLELRLPRWLPPDSAIIETNVKGDGVVQVTGDSGRLQEVMNLLGISDLKAPAGLDGKVVTLHVRPVVMIRYEHGRGGLRTRFFQAQPPELLLPAGVDLAQLGEIALRTLGMPPNDAHTFAQAIDWHTTLILPLPPTATSFRRLNINGHDAVAVQFQPPNESFTNMILWSTADRVYGLVSIREMEDVIAMANSIP